MEKDKKKIITGIAHDFSMMLMGIGIGFQFFNLNLGLLFWFAGLVLFFINIEVRSEYDSLW